MPVLALGQTGQQPSAPLSTDAQPTALQPATPQPANSKPITPSAVAAAASASRHARDSAPPIKVIGDDDLEDNNDSAAKSEAKPSDAAAQLKLSEDKTTRDEERKVRQFYSQGLTFKNQVKVQKGKIVDIQNHMTSLKNRFAAWSAGFAQDSDAQACWTSTYYTPYYRDWCDRGRNLKAQYEQLQHQLAQEKAKLEQMQERIRRAGYGNAVYDPD